MSSRRPAPIMDWRDPDYNGAADHDELEPYLETATWRYLEDHFDLRKDHNPEHVNFDAHLSSQALIHYDDGDDKDARLVRHLDAGEALDLAVMSAHEKRYTLAGMALHRMLCLILAAPEVEREIRIIAQELHKQVVRG